MKIYDARGNEISLEVLADIPEIQQAVLKNVATIGNGCDALDIVVLPYGLDIEAEKPKYEQWYITEYLPECREFGSMSKYMTLTQWLIKKGARHAEIKNFQY